MYYYKKSNGSVLSSFKEMGEVFEPISKEEYDSEIDKINEMNGEVFEKQEKSRQLTQDEVLGIFLAQNIQTLAVDDNTALRMKSFYPTWESLCNENDGNGYEAKTKGFKFTYFDSSSNETKLYKTVQDKFTFQSQWVPGRGTSAIYTQIVETQAGTLDDPIDVPADVQTNAFTYVIGKYYRWNGQIYKCERQGEVEGTEHSFVYSPDQLVGNYFTLVS